MNVHFFDIEIHPWLENALECQYFTKHEVNIFVSGNSIISYKYMDLLCFPFRIGIILKLKTLDHLDMEKCVPIILFGKYFILSM